MDDRARQNLFLLGLNGSANSAELQTSCAAPGEDACSQMQALMSQLEPNPISVAQHPQHQPQEQLLQRYLQQQQIYQEMQQRGQLMAAFQEQQQQLLTASSLGQNFQCSPRAEDSQGYNLIGSLQQQAFNNMMAFRPQQVVGTNDCLVNPLLNLILNQEQEQPHEVTDPWQPSRTFAPSGQTCAAISSREATDNIPTEAVSMTSAVLPPVSMGPFPSSNLKTDDASMLSGESKQAPVGDSYAKNGILGPWSATSQALLGSMAYDAAAKSHRPPPKKARSHLKKHKDKPKRPLSAYNIFFKEERQRILDNLPESSTIPDAASEEKPKRKRAHKPHGKIGFENLAKLIGERWHSLNPESADYYRKLAEEDSLRYRSEMEVYLKKQHEDRLSDNEAPA